MKFKLYREYGALNSVPVFDAFERGVLANGHEIVNTGEDIAVIWSVLWSGRMAGNQRIYNECINNGKPVIIIEVGNLKRNVTWRICLGHINGLGIFGNDCNLDQDRPQKLGLNLKPPKIQRKHEILIAAQHQASLQWQGMVPMSRWVQDIAFKLKSYTDRKIVIRPHPRSPFYVDIPGCTVERPNKIIGSYDDFDIDYNFHCVINHNAGPSVQAAINGTPIICDSSSLAGELSGKFENIENIVLPNRDEWFVKLCHTEWTVDEISKGIPLSRIFP